MNHVKSRVISKVAKRSDITTARIAVRLREDFNPEAFRYVVDVRQPGLLPPGRAMKVRAFVITDEPTVFDVIDLSDADVERFTCSPGLVTEEILES